MSEVRIVAESRTEFGKGAARRVRRAHKVPAVLYGHGTQPRHLSLPGHELMLALKGGSNTLLRLQVDGAEELALAKAVTRDPIRGFLEHLDLLLVRLGEKVAVEVPILLVGEIARGALLNHDLLTLSVEAEATAIPSELRVDVDGLEIGRHVLAKDVPLPAGVTLTGDPEALVVGIVAAPTAAQVSDDLAGTTEALPGQPSGEGDVVRDTASGSGGPAEG